MSAVWSSSYFAADLVSWSSSAIGCFTLAAADALPNTTRECAHVVNAVATIATEINTQEGPVQSRK